MPKGIKVDGVVLWDCNEVREAWDGQAFTINGLGNKMRDWCDQADYPNARHMAYAKRVRPSRPRMVRPPIS